MTGSLALPWARFRTPDHLTGWEVILTPEPLTGFEVIHRGQGELVAGCLLLAAVCVAGVMAPRSVWWCLAAVLAGACPWSFFLSEINYQDPSYPYRWVPDTAGHPIPVSVMENVNSPGACVGFLVTTVVLVAPLLLSLVCRSRRR